MVIPETFGRRGERVISTYNYADVADGTGITVFYGASTKNEDTLKYILTNQSSIYSNIKYTLSETVACDNTWVKALDIDFDITLNTPRNLRGSFKTNFLIYTSGVAGAGGTFSDYVITKIRKWDGSSETEIASVQSETTVSAQGTVHRKEYLTSVEIAKTHFKKGDVLRITVEVWVWRSAVGGTAYAVLAHDPMARSDATYFPADAEYSTVIKFHVPFDLDI